MAFRNKVRGPLGWILGAVGGLALLAGSFFAGMATAETPADQEPASVTEQQENAPGRDSGQGSSDGGGPDFNDDDGRHQRGDGDKQDHDGQDHDCENQDEPAA